MGSKTHRIIHKLSTSCSQRIRAEGEIERCPFSDNTFRADFSVVSEDDGASEGQSGSDSWKIGVGMEALEQFEKFVLIERIEPGAVVANDPSTFGRGVGREFNQGG